MAHDEALAERIRALLAHDPRFTEKRMFGGVSFLLDGRMSVTASGQGGLLVRLDPAEAEQLIADTPATETIMRGRTMKGWLRIASEHLESEAALRGWVERSVEWVAGLPDA